MFTKAELESFAKASASRDYRFDGRFFTAVKTTGIYCRPVCPARPKKENLEYFKTAIEAENAGYRPCLRCRPEVSPQSPAWIGTSATIKRGINLISKGYLFNSDEEKFASKLGIGARHLRRLFVDEIGFTAKQISDSQRLNFARTLVVETQLPITDIAFNSGFQSIRRFNDAFLKKFARKPSDLRKKKTSNLKIDSSVNLLLRYRPPYDWSSLIGFLERHYIPGIEHVTKDSYQRFFIDEHTNKPALLTVTHIADKNALQLSVIGADTRSLFPLSQKIRKMFDLDSDPILIASVFSKSKFLEKIYEKNPGLRLPQGWDPFETAIGTVLGQLVSTTQARNLVQQLVENYGTKHDHSFGSTFGCTFPSPKALSTKRTLQIGTTNQRKQTIIDLAKRVSQQTLDLSEHCDLQQLRSSLQEVKGIGPWSSEYICLRAIGDTDAFPAKDLILARVLKNHPDINHEEIKPWRSYLSMYLWKEFAHVYSGTNQNIKEKKMLFKKQINSPIGKLTLIASDKGIREIIFEKSSEKHRDAVKNDTHPILLKCEKELHEYFQGKRSDFSVPLEIEGTEFQRKAWNALTKIPYGKTTSYAEQAVHAGNYKAIRAIGAANGKNPIPIIIPCHRVIASTGHLHGFGGGLSTKQKLLEIEGVQIDQKMNVVR